MLPTRAQDETDQLQEGAGISKEKITKMSFKKGCGSGSRLIICRKGSCSTEGAWKN